SKDAESYLNSIKDAKSSIFCVRSGSRLLNDLQKATCNFTTLIGQGAFGPVYKAQMSTSETVAVKVLATYSTGEKHEPLNWDLRVYIALRGLEYLRDGRSNLPNILLDQSMRARVNISAFSLKSQSINHLEFLMSWWIIFYFRLLSLDYLEEHAANIRGAFGYLDPEYVSTRTYTKQRDVYDSWVLLFELIAGRNPQQGLMEFVELVDVMCV
ncbi:Protein kinase domain, partial [Arabidopsis thaliana x Arabidopsis arenosa]